MAFDPNQPFAAPSTPTGSPPINPYAPPSADVTPMAGQVDNAEAIRRDHLSHEASIRSIGLLYLLGFAGTLVAGLAALALLLTGEETAFAGFLLAFVVVFGLLYYYLGMGLRRLDPRVRLGVTLFAVVGLLGFPLGTLINGYILYLLHSEKGKRIMTYDYQQVVAATPHIKYKTPLWVWIFLLLIIALIVLLILAV